MWSGEPLRNRHCETPTLIQSLSVLSYPALNSPGLTSTAGNQPSNNLQFRRELMNKGKKFLWVVALAVGSAGLSVPVFAHQDHQQRDNRNDRYANNEAYQQGIREGFEDHDGRHHKRKKPHFDKTEDRKAYNEGYQHGYKGDEQYRPH